MKEEIQPDPSKIAPPRSWWPKRARSRLRWWLLHPRATREPHWRGCRPRLAESRNLRAQNSPAGENRPINVYGAQVILVDGNYDAAFDLTIEAAREFDWYCRNTGYNPYTAEGKKTCAFEIWEQICLTQRRIPNLCVFLFQSVTAISFQDYTKDLKTW